LYALFFPIAVGLGCDLARLSFYFTLYLFLYLWASISPNLPPRHPHTRLSPPSASTCVLSTAKIVVFAFLKMTWTSHGHHSSTPHRHLTTTPGEPLLHVPAANSSLSSPPHPPYCGFTPSHSCPSSLRSLYRPLSPLTASPSTGWRGINRLLFVYRLCFVFKSPTPSNHRRSGLTPRNFPLLAVIAGSKISTVALPLNLILPRVAGRKVCCEFAMKRACL